MFSGTQSEGMGGTLESDDMVLRLSLFIDGDLLYIGPYHDSHSRREVFSASVS